MIGSQAEQREWHAWSHKRGVHVVQTASSVCCLGLWAPQGVGATGD